MKAQVRIAPELFIAIATNTPAGVFAWEQFATDQQFSTDQQFATDQQWKIERVPSGSDLTTGTVESITAPIVATAGWNERELRALLVAKKHVVVLEPHLASAAGWNKLHQLACANGVWLNGYSLAPDDGDAAMALSAFNSDRSLLGPLVSVRWTDSRWSEWGNTANHPSAETDGDLVGRNRVGDDLGESSIRNLWRQRLFPIVQTAVQLVGEQFVSVDCWPGPPSRPGDALLVVLQTPGGIVLQIDIRHRAFVRYHSGWLLEGTTGGYHAGKRYWHASDGEVLDEPIPPVPVWTLPNGVARGLERWRDWREREAPVDSIGPTLRLLGQILDAPGVESQLKDA